jgi:tetratricopeptide (TPR) repeat protein
MNQKRFELFNNVIGWLMFAIAAFVYLSTIEPTVSIWDCGEFIAGSYKLEVVHPPGAPFFLMFNHLFTMFAGNDPTLVPKIVNGVSAISSALTILFLFWTSTLLSRKIFVKDESNYSVFEIIGVFGAGIVGALAFTFSDTFWFSAVEGEVYALSSTFTAIVFWLLLKWDRRADEPNNLRWLIVVFFLMGISIGIHLLSLLALPVLAFVYYFRKYEKITNKGLIIALVVAAIILQFINVGLIKWFPSIATKFELLFVNGLGMPYWSGVIIFIILFLGALAYGIYYSIKKNRILLNTIFVGIVVVFIGYSSYTMVAIRSVANTPIDYSNPDNIFNMLSYINREQYGDRPLFYGPHFASDFKRDRDGRVVNKKGRMQYIQKDGKYVPTVHKKKPLYESADKMLFPRLGDTRADRVEGYKVWSGMRKGQKKPTFANNLRFFFSYQLGHMYWRYFAWNFIGRQNDEQGHGRKLSFKGRQPGFMDGNWVSGIKFIDEALVGSQDKLPYAQRVNNAHNKLYFLPFILGLLGMVFHFKKSKRDAFSTMILFLFTGIILVIYQNSPPFEPRERDYTLVGSFYVFSIWVGFGILSIANYLKNKINPVLAVSVTSVVALLAAPVLMASQEWDDHTRAHRYTSLHHGENYLNSCAKDAILFTNGDNDTYPLWYAQEVENIRSDVRVINLQLLMTDWYVDQLRVPQNESSAIKFSFDREKITEGTRDYVPYVENPSLGLDPKAFYDLGQILNFIKSDKPQDQIPYGDERLSYYPVSKFFMKVDKDEVIANKVVDSSVYDRIADELRFSVGKRNLLKSHLMQLDIINNNLWERPVYFAITAGGDTYLGLEHYFQQEGMTYRMTPVRKTDVEKQQSAGQTGRVDPKIMYENMVHKFKWGNLEDPRVHIGSVTRRHTLNYRNVFATLARSLIFAGENEKAIEAIDLCLAKIPEEKVPHQINSLTLAEIYFMAGATDKALALSRRLMEVFSENLDYFKSLDRKFMRKSDNEVRNNFYGLSVVRDLAQRYQQTEFLSEVEAEYQRQQQIYGIAAQ